MDDQQFLKLQRMVDDMPDEEDQKVSNIDKNIKQLKKKLDNDQQEKTDPAKINTFLALETYIINAGKQNDKQYFLKLLAKKQKLLQLIKSKKINAENYSTSLKKIDIKNIHDEKLVTYIQKELSLLEKSTNNIGGWFNMLVDKISSTLSQQQNRYATQTFKQQVQKNKIPSITQNVKKQIPSNYEVQQPVKPTGLPMNKNDEIILKLDSQSIQKKLEYILRAVSKIQSLIIYYKQNLLQSKQKELKQILIPKKENSMQIVKNLLQNKNVPIGKFYMAFLKNQLDFETFHGKNRKEYQNDVDNLIKKYKEVQKKQTEFRKKCSRSKQNNNTLAKSDQLLKMYTQDLQYLKNIKLKDFIPLPLSKLVLEQRQNYSENLNIKKNDLQIIIKKIQGLSQTTTLKIYVDSQQHSSKNYQVNNGDPSIDYTITLPQGLIKQIHKKNLKFKFQQKMLLFFKSEAAFITIQLKQFLDKNCIEGVIQSNKIKITYQFNIRLPRNRMSKTKMEAISIKKFPQYVHSQQFQLNFLKKYINISSTIPPSNPSPPVNPNQVINPKPINSQISLSYVQRNDQVINILKQIKVEGIQTQKILKPEIFCDSLGYLDNIDKILDKASNEIYSWKKNRPLIEQMQDQIMKKKMYIQTNRKSGKISEQKYQQMLQLNYSNDKKLSQIYIKYGLEPFSKFLNSRMQIILKELKPSNINNNQNQNQKSNISKGLDLSPFKLFYVKRSIATNQIIDNIKGPINMVQIQKIRFPQKYCLSSKFLNQFDIILDAVEKQVSVGDKLNKKYCQELQDEVLKNKAIVQKQKLSPEQQKALIKSAIQLDKKLVQIYKKLNLPEYQKFIYSRLKLLKLQIGQAPFLEPKTQLLFDINVQRELFQIQYTPQIVKIIQKLSPQLKNPQQYCECMTYIEKMLQLSKNKVLITKLTNIKQRFEKQGQQGTLDLQKYLQNLKKTLQQDINRSQAYKKLGLKDHYYFIKARIKLVQQQIAQSQQ